jgi:hypothetical protein
VKVFPARFPDIRNSVKELIGKPIDARKFVATHDMNVKAEIVRLSNELTKLDQPWVLRVKTAS